MIDYVKITNPLGEELKLELRSPETSGFFIRGINGLGPAKSTINTTEVLSSDGSFYNSSRVGSRNIVMDLGFYPDGSETIEFLRQKTYRFFPMKKQLTIEVATENRTGITTGYVESNEPDIFSNSEGTTISILCQPAFFYGKEYIQTIFSGVNSLFEFPWENPSLTDPLIEFGSVFINTQGNVFYTGDEPTGVVIYVNFTGNVNNLSISNITNGQNMVLSSSIITAITGNNLKLGDQLIISTVRGNKFIYLIRNGVTYNILNALSTNSVWFTVDRGDNVFTYTAGSGLANMQFLIEHQIVYGGL